MPFASSRETGRISVIAVLGAPGSGKTHFLNHLLGLPALKNTVLLTASDDVQAKHNSERVLRLASLRESSDSGCFCCGMRSGLGDALRDLFLRALSKKISTVDRVIIEANLLDPESLKFTLKHAPFLGQRYVFRSAFLLIDVGHFTEKTMNFEGLGVEFADYVVFSKTEMIDQELLQRMMLAVKQLNLKVKVVLSVDKLEALLANTLH